MSRHDTFRGLEVPNDPYVLEYLDKGSHCARKAPCSAAATAQCVLCLYHKDQQSQLKEYHELVKKYGHYKGAFLPESDYTLQVRSRPCASRGTGTSTACDGISCNDCLYDPKHRELLEEYSALKAGLPNNNETVVTTSNTTFEESRQDTVGELTKVKAYAARLLTMLRTAGIILTETTPALGPGGADEDAELFGWAQLFHRTYPDALERAEELGIRQPVDVTTVPTFRIASRKTVKVGMAESIKNVTKAMNGMGMSAKTAVSASKALFKAFPASTPVNAPLVLDEDDSVSLALWKKEDKPWKTQEKRSKHDRRRHR